VTVLEHMVHAEGGAKPFGEFTLADVQARADELRTAATAGGPAVRVLPVAHAWGELARAMERGGAATVLDLGEQYVQQHAEQLWVIPPGGSLLRS
jgi:hypothetical protein